MPSVFTFFYWNKEDLNQQICLIKYEEREREGGAKT